MQGCTNRGREPGGAKAPAVDASTFLHTATMAGVACYPKHALRVRLLTPAPARHGGRATSALLPVRPQEGESEGNDKCEKSSTPSADTGRQTRPLQRTRLGTRTALSWRQRRGERYGKTAPRTRPHLAARSRVAQTRGALQPRSGEWGEVHGHGRVQRAACGFLALRRPWRLQPPDAGAARVGGRRLVTRLGGTSPPGRREHFLKGRFQESRLRQSPTGSLAASGCAFSFAAGPWTWA